MHVEAKPIKDYPWYLRLLYRSQEKKMGQVLLPGLCWGRVPLLQVLFLLFWNYLDRKKSPLDPALRALVQVRVAQNNWCKFCVDYNALNLLKRTNSLEKLDHLYEWKTNPMFLEIERYALEYADILSGEAVVVPSSLIDNLKKFLTDDQIVELTALISFQNMSAKFNAGLNIPSQGLCRRPDSSECRDDIIEERD